MESVEFFDEHVKEIKDRFHRLTDHHYLQRYLPKPEIDDDKVRFLFAMLQEHFPTKDAYLFTLSTLLVQAGLDIHEQVSLHDIRSESLRKVRQLTVLAGDYYVGLYYHMLANSEHVSLIQAISHTIQEINEVKMNVYEDVCMDNLETSVSVIETGLMQKVAEYFGHSRWQTLFKDFFYLKRLLQEKSIWLSGKTTHVLKSLQDDNYGVEEAISLVEVKIEEVKDRLLTNSKHMNSVESFITWHIDQLIGRPFFENVAKGE